MLPLLNYFGMLLLPDIHVAVSSRKAGQLFAFVQVIPIEFTSNCDDHFAKMLASL